ncbi:golgin subfamily A member 6-like protein 6 [Pieris brassicae]|uniref:golgin subfamily A member 6-like protein 6 n=1 Tax=Pieris brassicae TaxID=7116 RepID=UPI001E65E547|nr:golgin subfamily A member 6-like protein 6 [Pieris brassicae]XP_045522758.1 golgin subfamily A member 6-like protein 6 [Pieris brassicae]
MPLVMSKDEWSKIIKWTDSNREDPEVARRREYVKHLNESSRNMTKHWPNSLENVNKRSEEVRRARIEAAEQANSRFYQQYLRKKRQEQRELMYSARETVFKNKDAPKLLLSAVIETAIQKERQEQIKFNNELKRLEEEQKRKDDDDIIRKAKEWHELNDLRKNRRFEVNKQHQKEILDQAHEVSERNRTEYESELEMQKVDNIRANEEMDELKKFEEEFKSAEKARILSDMRRARQEYEHRRQEADARDKCDDKLIEVLQKATARVARRRKQTESDLKAEKLRVLEAISKKLESGDAAREALENEHLQKAIREKEAAADARRAADARKREKFIAERKEVREAFLKKEEQRIHEFNTMRQWEIMNRFKNAELYEDFKEKLKQEKEKKIREYREDILKLWKERDDREAKELAETRYFYGELAEKKLREADNKLLTLGGKLLDEAREHHRPEYALHRAVDRYCKQYRLYAMPPLPGSLQEHFGDYAPRDVSKPDPDYCYPAPPADEADGKRDGLRPTRSVAGPSKPERQQEPVAEYKRKGPANGLQTKPGSPPKLVPCKTESCRCELKK